jgi:hypothetical protein
MTRCLNCGEDRAADQCEACGLTSAAAELVFRRRLINLTAVFLVGAIAFLPAAHMFPPLELDGMLIFIGAVFFLTLGLAVWLDFRARRHADIEVWKRVFRSLVPVPWLLAGLLLVNARLDPDPPVAHVTTVTAKFTMPGALRTSRLVVASWRPGRRVERIPVGPQDYTRFSPGDRVEVRVHSGLVGIPWVSSVYRR